MLANNPSKCLRKNEITKQEIAVKKVLSVLKDDFEVSDCLLT